MKNSLIIAFLATALAACGTSGRNPSDAIGERQKLIGIWKMFPLKGGIANVVEFTPTGESRLYPHNCITKAQEPPEISHYVVNSSNQTIQLQGDGTSQTLKILSVGDRILVLSQSVGGEDLRFRYVRGSDLTPFCGSDALWEKERIRRVPYAPSDFVAAPIIPPHPEMSRYEGRWATDKGAVQIEVKRVTDGSYQLNKDASENWTHLLNTVHWKGDELHYTAFAYSNRSDLFDHPFHKSTYKCALTPEPDGVSMKYTFFINDKKYDLILTRK